MQNTRKWKRGCQRKFYPPKWIKFSDVYALTPLQGRGTWPHDAVASEGDKLTTYYKVFCRIWHFNWELYFIDDKGLQMFLLRDVTRCSAMTSLTQWWPVSFEAATKCANSVGGALLLSSSWSFVLFSLYSSIQGYQNKRVLHFEIVALISSSNSIIINQIRKKINKLFSSPFILSALSQNHVLASSDWRVAKVFCLN